MNLAALLEQRNKALAEARVIADAAGENAITSDQRETYDQLIERSLNLSKRIEDESRLVEQERDAAQRALEHRADPGGAAAPGAGEQRGGDPLAEQRAARHTELRKFLAGPTGSFQMRALQADNDVEGGSLVGPETFVAQLIKGVDDAVFVRRYATKYQVQRGSSLGVPTMDADLADADWTVELATGGEDTSLRFGKRELKPNPLAKRVKISKTLVASGRIPVDQLVRDRLVYKLGNTAEKAFLTGNGAGQPLGVFVASADGVPTSRDVSEGNAATEIEWVGLQAAKYSMKGQYWNRMRWLFHRDAVKQIASKRDGDGRFLWEPSHVAGQPDTIVGIPFDVSEYAPNTFTANQYVGLLADWATGYWIADAMEMELQQLLELYAETNQNGYIGRLESDGMPVLAEAFARVKLGS